MTVTVGVGEDRRVRVTDDVVEIRPPDRIAFAIEGTVRVTEELLGQFEGATLEPVRVEIASGERTVEIDLGEEAALRLETVDVGVETPGSDTVPSEGDAIEPSANGASVDDVSVDGASADSASADDDAESDETRPGAIAFTVDGAIVDVPEKNFDAISRGSPSLESLTFAVEDPVRSDGGAGPDDVIFECSLLGYGIVVRRNGTVVIGGRGGLATADLP